MNEKIIYQLLDGLRGTALTATESLELALQLIVWVKLTNGETLSPDLRLSASLANDPIQAKSALAKLGQKKGLIGQAFSNTRNLDRIEPLTFQSLLGLSLSLNDAGVLKNIDASDMVNSLASFVPGETAIPNEVAALLVGLGRVGSKTSVYAPWDSCGQIAESASREAREVYLESPVHSAIPALVSLLSVNQFQVQYSDPIRAPSAIDAGKPRQFDVAIAFPPMGFRYEADVVDRDWYRRFPERTMSGAVLAVRHLLSQARQRVVVAVPNSLLFSTGAELALREDLIRSGKVEAVIAMPSGLLAYTTVPFAVLVLSPEGGHGSIKFVNADVPHFRESTSKAKCRLVHANELVEQLDGQVASENVAAISKVEVLQNDAQLQVSRYVLQDSAKQLQARLDSAPAAILGDVVSTVRPMPTSSGDAECIEAFEVGAADLPPHGYISQASRAVNVDRQVSLKNRDQFLQPLDIVLIVKGSVGKIGIVPQDVPPPGPGGWIAGQSAIVLRVGAKHDIDPRALAVQLRSQFGQELLKTIVSGASIKLIQLRELMRLRVLAPSMDECAHAAEVLDRETYLQREIERLRQEQAQVAENMWPLV